MVAGSFGWLGGDLDQLAGTGGALYRVALTSAQRSVAGEMAVGVFDIAHCTPETAKTISTGHAMDGLILLLVPIAKFIITIYQFTAEQKQQ